VKGGPKGGIVWTKTFHRQNLTRYAGLSVLQTPDFGFIVGGCTVAGINPTGFVMKVNPMGQEVFWTASTDNISSIGSVKATGAGDYIACGNTASGTNGGLDVLLQRFDETGGISWIKYLGGPLNDAGFSVFPTKDNGFAVTGYTTQAGSSTTSIYLAKTDGQGALIK
jgi:hypothetical protein